MEQQLHRIVIVGGGAGGLELATKLGNSLGKKNLAEIFLVDAKKTHVWKPLLHEIAAGSLNPDKDELEYLAQAHWHHFKFRYGRVDDVDAKNQTITIAPTLDIDGVEIIPQRKIKYDTLVLSVGSTVNDFNIPGAKEHAVALDTQYQAERFHQKLHNSILRAQTQAGSVRPGQLEVVIVGGGATGVELAAELHKATREMAAYGLDRINPDRDISIHLVAHQVTPVYVAGQDYPQPNAYRIKGGGTFADKADNVICVWRPFRNTDKGNPSVKVLIDKIKKQRLTGVTGEKEFIFDFKKNRYYLDGRSAFDNVEVKQTEIKLETNNYFLNDKTNDEPF